MKRILLVLVVVAAAGLLVPFFTAFAQSPLQPTGGCSSSSLSSSASGSNFSSMGTTAPVCCSPAMPCAAAPETAGDDKVIDELTAILKETKSPETFVVTTCVLGRMGPKAKRALPAIIRNAERLELLEDALKDQAAANPSTLTQKLLEAIEMIVDKHAASRNKLPAGYGAPPSTWNAPVVAPTPCAPASTAPIPAAPPAPASQSKAPQGVLNSNF